MSLPIPMCRRRERPGAAAQVCRAEPAGLRPPRPTLLAPLLALLALFTAPVAATQPSAHASDTAPVAAPQLSQPSNVVGSGDAAPATPATDDAWPSLTELLALPAWMDLSLTLDAAPISNPIGGLRSASNWIQLSELTLQVGSGLGRDPSSWREIDHWQARIRLDHFLGQANYADTIGSFFAPQTLAYSPGLYLSDISVQRSSRDQSLRISAGYQSMDQDFLVSPSYQNYLFSGFNDTLNLTIPGLPITPFAAPSLVLNWQSPGFGSWRVGSYWLDQETELAGLLGAPNGLAQDLRGTLQILQWDLPLWASDRSLQGPLTRSGGGTIERQLAAPLLQLGAFRTQVRFNQPAISPTGRNPLRNQVVFGSLNLPLQLPLGLDNRLWGTLQWGLNPDQNITPLFLAGGWQCQGLFPERPLDVLSLGIGRSAFSPVLLPQSSWAGVLELNYSLQINHRLSLQPVLQWFMRPSGNGRVPSILTTALQLSLVF